MSTHSHCRSISRIAAGALCLLVSTPLLAQWGTPVVDTVSVTSPVIGKQTYQQSLAADQSAHLHAVWGEERSGPVGGVWVMYRTNAPTGTWRLPETVNIGGEIAFAPALALLPSGSPIIAYEANDSLVLALRTFENWLRQPIAGPTDFACCPTVAVDSVGIPHLAWISESPNLDLYRIAYFYNMWGSDIQILEGSELGMFGLGAAPQLTVTPEGIAHIFYRGGGFGNYHIHHAWNNVPGGTQWNYEVLFSGNAEDYLASPRFGRDGTLHLAVSGNDGFGFPGRVYYFRKFPARPWETPEEATAGFSTNCPSLDLDWRGIPYIVSMEISGNILTGNLIASERSLAWFRSSVLAGNDYFNPSLAVFPDSYGHVLCNSGGNTGSYHVLHLRSAEPLSDSWLCFCRVLPVDSSMDPWYPFPYVRFSWVHASALTYVLRVFAPEYGGYDETFVTTDTSFDVEIPLPVLDEQFTFYWTVGAVMGTDTIGAANGTGIFFLNIQDADEPRAQQPSAFALAAYPNPFNPVTTLAFSLRRAEAVDLTVFDLTGRRIQTLLQERLTAGEHRIAFDGAKLASGLYLAHLRTATISATQKLLLIK